MKNMTVAGRVVWCDCLVHPSIADFQRVAEYQLTHSGSKAAARHSCYHSATRTPRPSMIQHDHAFFQTATFPSDRSSWVCSGRVSSQLLISGPQVRSLHGLALYG